MAVPEFPFVAARAVVFGDDFWVRGTTRRGSDIRFVLTTTSIGLLVIFIVVPGFISVRILLFKYGYIYAYDCGSTYRETRPGLGTAGAASADAINKVVQKKTRILPI